MTVGLPSASKPVTTLFTQGSIISAGPGKPTPSVCTMNWRFAEREAAGSLLEGDGDRTGPGRVDGEEVTVVGDEVARGRLHRVGSDHCRDETRWAVGVGDQGVPFRVDVELHRPHRTEVLEDLRQGDHRLAVGGDVDEVAATVDTDAGAPDAGDAAEGVPPLRAVRVVVQLRVELPVPDDWSQALAGPGDARPWVRAAAPLHDRYATVAIANERGVAVRQRLRRAAVVGRAITAVGVGEAAVEGREQARALIVRDHHRPAYGGVGRLVSARVIADRGARSVEPGDVGDELRIVELRAEGRHQHRWATVNRRAGRLPGAFSG